MSRTSVFSRLGPREGAEEVTAFGKSKSQGGSDNLSSLLKGLKSLDDEIIQAKQRKDGSQARRKNTSSARPRNPHEEREVVKKPEQPARLLQRTLSGLQNDTRSRGQADTRSEASSRNTGTQAESKQLSEQLRKLEEERKAAQELADALILQQQALMEEKQRVQRENMALQTEKQHLLERLTYLEEYDDVDDLGSPYTLDPSSPSAFKQQYLELEDENDGTCDTLDLNKLQLE